MRPLSLAPCFSNLSQRQSLERFVQMILDNLAAGLRDHKIIEKLQISHMSYYRYKLALSKQIADFKSKISDEDIALAEEMLENRLTRDRVRIDTAALYTKNEDSSKIRHSWKKNSLCISNSYQIPTYRLGKSP
jgi:hypothetical protein